MAIAPSGRRQALLPGCLTLILTLAIACSSGGHGEQPPVSQDCPPATNAGSPDASAEALLLLVRDQQPFVQANLPAYQLWQAFVLWPDQGTSFLYISADGRGVAVRQEASGQWLAGDSVSIDLPSQDTPLDPSELRHGAESIVRRFEEQVPGIEVGGLGLVREACELQWRVGGWLTDGEGRRGEVVEGVIPDTTGEFQITRRYDFAGSP